MNAAIAKKLQILAGGILLVCSYSAYQAWGVLAQKIDSQRQVTESIQKWTEGFKALNSSIDRWEKTYPKFDDLKDMRAIIEVLNIESAGLKFVGEDVSVREIQPIKHAEAELEMDRVCVSVGRSSGGDGVDVRADSYQALLSGIRAIAKRPEIELGGVTVRGDLNAPAATLHGFCLLVSRS